ncbi:MAG: hypothetical protein JXB05_33570 [Myxococcaceae bacterium]|nr:hypothetical protein [Myxococcaceae bacterium]
MSMQSQLLRYFTEEKVESALFVGVGVVAIAVSVWLWRTGSGYRGMAYPLIGVALIQLVVGGTVFLRTDGQVAALTAQLASDPAAYQAAEVARMEVVMRSFALYKVIELALFAVGVALTYVFRQKETLYAVGVGLVVQSSLMLVADLFAERRGDIYLEQVRVVGEKP